MANKFFDNWIVRNLLRALVLVLALVILCSIALSLITRHGRAIGIPDMTNMTVEQAMEIAALNDFKIEVVDSVYANGVGRGCIFSQNPKGGSSVKKDRKVRLVINAVNSKQIMMPDLVGYSMRQAKGEINSKGLVLGRLIYVEDIATNNVLKQLYHTVEVEPGTFIDSGAEIDLVVGLDEYDNVTYVPDVIGMKYSRAIDAVQDNSLNIGRKFFDDTVETYADTTTSVVYRQSPSASGATLDMGSEVSLYFTKDYSKVPQHTSEQ